MSIIAEALKKAQGASIQKTPQQKEEASPPPVRKDPRTSTPSKKTLPQPYARRVLAGGIIIILTAILFFAFPHQAPTEKEASLTEKSTYVVEQKTEKTQVSQKMPAPVTLTEANKEINLNGIMYTPQKALAVINKSIWGVGDVIGKFTILKIGKDYVTIGSGSSSFDIRLKR